MTLARASTGNRVSCSSANDREQAADPGVALRSHDAELGRMRPQGIDDLRAVLRPLMIFIAAVSLKARSQTCRRRRATIPPGRRRLLKALKVGRASVYRGLEGASG
jgi:hypothetical protein